MLRKSFFILVAICLSIGFYSDIAAQTNDTLPYKPAIKVKALIQTRYEATLTDSVTFSNTINPDAVNNNFRIRRAELRTDFTFNPDLKGVIRVQIPALKSSAPGAFLELAYAEWRIHPMFQITAGQFKVPFDLDELTSQYDLRMIDRGTTNALLSANSETSYQPGVMIFGKLKNDRPVFNYYLALQNGSNRSVNFDIDNQKNLTARVEYFAVKELRLAANVQKVGVEEDNGVAYGGDISWQNHLNEKNLLITEFSYTKGFNSAEFIKDTMDTKSLLDYDMMGYLTQILWKTDLLKQWCRTFELGGRYEFTDPLIKTVDNAFNSITGVIGFTFLPDNAARLQLELSRYIFEQEVTGALKNFNRFMVQLQFQI
ncbi:MAG: porin [Chitinophagales bacterium]